MGRRKLLNPEAELSVCRDYESGMSRQALADHHGVSVGLIGIILRRHKVPNHQRDLNDVEKKSLCEDYAQGWSGADLAEKYGVTLTTVYQTMRTLGVACRLKVSPHVKTSSEQDLEMVTRYRAGESLISLTKVFSVSPSALKRKLLMGGVEMRSTKEANRGKQGRTLNHHAFDVLTDSAAYWVGMLMADGCISDKTGNSLYVTLGLNADDIDHVRSFRDFMGSNHVLSNKVVGTRKDGTPIRRAGISFASDHVAATLASYGVVPRKSLVAKVIGLEANRHFWRGVIDGDGSISITPDGYPHIGLTGNVLLVEQFHEYVRALLPLSKNNPIRDKRTENLRHYRVGCRWAWHLIHELYRDCEIALPRKLETARKILATPYATPMRRDWSHLTWEYLCELRASHESWSDVAKMLGLHKDQFTTIRKRARLNAGILPPESPEKPSLPRQLDLFD